MKTTPFASIAATVTFGLMTLGVLGCSHGARKPASSSENSSIVAAGTPGTEVNLRRGAQFPQKFVKLAEVPITPEDRDFIQRPLVFQDGTVAICSGEAPKIVFTSPEGAVLKTSIPFEEGNCGLVVQHGKQMLAHVSQGGFELFDSSGNSVRSTRFKQRTFSRPRYLPTGSSFAMNDSVLAYTGWYGRSEIVDLSGAPVASIVLEPNPRTRDWHREWLWYARLANESRVELFARDGRALAFNPSVNRLQIENDCLAFRREEAFARDQQSRAAECNSKWLKARRNACLKKVEARTISDFKFDDSKLRAEMAEMPYTTFWSNGSVSLSTLMEARGGSNISMGAGLLSKRPLVDAFDIGQSLSDTQPLPLNDGRYLLVTETGAVFAAGFGQQPRLLIEAPAAVSRMAPLQGLSGDNVLPASESVYDLVSATGDWKQRLDFRYPAETTPLVLSSGTVIHVWGGIWNIDPRNGEVLAFAERGDQTRRSRLPPTEGTNTIIMIGSGAGSVEFWKLQ